jgi:hypothetical protein
MKREEWYLIPTGVPNLGRVVLEIRTRPKGKKEVEMETNNNHPAETANANEPVPQPELAKVPVEKKVQVATETRKPMGSGRKFGGGGNNRFFKGNKPSGPQQKRF